MSGNIQLWLPVLNAIKLFEQCTMVKVEEVFAGT